MCKLLLDTGSVTSLLAKRYLPKKATLLPKPENLKLFAVTGHEIEVFGMAKIQLKTFNFKTITVDWRVAFTAFFLQALI